ncbi:unnamed protein product [Prunus armeniaca]
MPVDTSSEEGSLNHVARDELSNRGLSFTNPHSRFLNTRAFVPSSTRANYPAKGLQLQPTKVFGT